MTFSGHSQAYHQNGKEIKMQSPVLNCVVEQNSVGNVDDRANRNAQ